MAAAGVVAFAIAVACERALMSFTTACAMYAV